MRVQLLTKRLKATTFTCNRCDKPIVVGENYYQWKHNHAPARRHAEHGRPRQSELCTGKMSGVYAAVEGLEDDIEAGRKGNDISGLEYALNEAASAVREVAEEYESNIDNMPESLQSSPTAEDAREKSEALNEFADALESAAGDIDSDIDEEPEEPEDHEADCELQKIVDAGGEAPSDACTCGYEEKVEAHENWEQAIEEAFSTAEDAAGELSI